MPKLRVKTKLVCAKCGADWKAHNNPAICPECREGSFGIAVKADTGGKGHARED